MSHYRMNLILRYILKLLSIRKYQIERRFYLFTDKVMETYHKIEPRKFRWDNIYIASLLLTAIAACFITYVMFRFHEMNPNRGYDIETPGSVLYGNPWVPICWAFCIIAILQIIIGAIYVITIPIRRWLAKFIQRQKEDIAYFEEFNNIKPRNEEALFEEDEEAPGLFDDIHDYDEVKEKRKRS